MPPLAAWEKVILDVEAYFADDVHAEVGCVECHGGQNVDDMEAAHEGMVTDPSASPVDSCGECHPDIQAAHETSLHATLAGYDYALDQRSTPENHPALDEMQEYHCSECHATCGQCHLAQPHSVGGGLLEGHAMVTSPPMSRVCTACHGSRVGNEYLGKNEGIPGDVHLTAARMTCTDCHTGDEMHGEGMANAEYRYSAPRTPQCVDCHQDVGDSNDYHVYHGLTVSCQTCHSQEYTNCTNCHVEQTAEGVPFYSVEEHWLGFYIGRNANRDFEYPWAYGTVRHVPADPNQYEFYGDNLLDRFDSRPTFAWSTPHNIQLRTPQTQTCESCHGNPEYFLTADKVPPEELEANLDIITGPPPPVDELLARWEPENTVAQPEGEEDEAGVDADAEGTGE